MLPREKLLQEGASTLTLEELLAVILNTGTHKLSVFQLAQKLAPLIRGAIQESRFKQFLSNLPGLGNTKQAQILALLELSRRLAVLNDTQVISSPADVYKITSYLARYKQERLVAILLDTNMRIKNIKQIAIGTDDAIQIDLFKLYRQCIRSNSRILVLAHNHPSGNPSPSQNDIITTTKIYKGGKLLGIKLLDHIIIGKDSYFSFKQAHLLE